MAKKKSNQRSSTSADVYIGERIREARMSRRLSQSELGDALKVSFQQVQKYEKGVNRVSLTRIQQVAEATGKPVAFFIANSNESYANADPNITRLLTSREGYELAVGWFAASPAARKVMLSTLKQFVKEGA